MPGLPANPDNQLPALLPAAPPRPALVPERNDFLEGDAPAADKVEAFLARALEAHGDGSATAGALVPWICDALLSNHSVKAYGRDFMDFVRHMQAQGVRESSRRPEECHALADAEASDRPPAGHPHRQLAGYPRPSPDERVLPDRVPGAGCRR